MFHGVLFVTSGLFHGQTLDEHSQYGNNPQSQRQPPDSSKVVLAEAGSSQKVEDVNYENIYIQNRTRGTNAETTKPKSIIASVIISDGSMIQTSKK